MNGAQCIFLSRHSISYQRNQKPPTLIELFFGVSEGTGDLLVAQLRINLNRRQTNCELPSLTILAWLAPAVATTAAVRSRLIPVS